MIAPLNEYNYGKSFAVGDKVTFSQSVTPTGELTYTFNDFDVSATDGTRVGKALGLDVATSARTSLVNGLASNTGKLSSLTAGSYVDSQCLGRSQSGAGLDSQVQARVYRRRGFIER